jgi:hypothetical protein
MHAPSLSLPRKRGRGRCGAARRNPASDSSSWNSSALRTLGAAVDPGLDQFAQLRKVHSWRRLRSTPLVWTARNRASITPALSFVRHPRGRGAQVAQLVEHCTENAGVGGSNPPLGTINAAPRFGVRSRPFDGRSRCRASTRIAGMFPSQLDRDLAALHARKDDDARESLTRVSVRFAEDW